MMENISMEVWKGQHPLTQDHEIRPWCRNIIEALPLPLKSDCLTGILLHLSLLGNVNVKSVFLCRNALGD